MQQERSGTKQKKPSKKFIQPRTLKGFRDFLPPQAIAREILQEKIRATFQSYGFDPIETPALEYLEVFAGQIGEDEKLFYQFEDRGGRSVALRYDQTVPTARVVAQYQSAINLPFKRYQIQTVWRAEKPQAGRYREFLQCDADILGISNPEADAELIALSMDIYKNLGFSQVRVLINDRALFAEFPYTITASIDKIRKIGQAGVISEIIKKGFSKTEAKRYLRQLKNIKPGSSLRIIFNYLETAGFPTSWYQFEPTLMRSFSYSTGPIWEVEIPGFEEGSVLGGERYDGLVGNFGKKDIPATGFGLGFDRTLAAMRQFGLLPTPKTKTQILVTVFSKKLLAESLKLAASFRKIGLNTDLYPDPNCKLDKQVRYAGRKEIPWVAILGPDEVKSGRVTLKNMRTREQEKLKTKEAIKKISAKKTEKQG